VFQIRQSALSGRGVGSDTSHTHGHRAAARYTAEFAKEGATVTAEELRGFLEPRFAKFWLPDEFVFTSEIPQTAAGKFRKSALREQYGGILIDQPEPEDL
jgi:acyl-CoA synthetase (AMP-forming)/AMP-acid ligase II